MFSSVVAKVDLDNELVRHFLIETTKRGVRLKGLNDEPVFGKSYYSYTCIVWSPLGIGQLTASKRLTV